MKKLITLLLITPFLLSCSSDDDEQTQDYTSFVVYHNEDANLTNSVSGYYSQDGTCHKLGNLGNLTKGKFSEEVLINIDTLKYIYIFTDYISPRRLDTVFVLKKNMKNVFEIKADTKGIEVDKANQQQYPQ